jgi:uncharacterized iron-regulated protein
MLVAGFVWAGAVHAVSADPAVLDALPQADVVILGEIHDNPKHHENQARAVRAIEPAALVFEMLTLEQAARITPELRDDPDALARVLDWEASGWPAFDDYHPIFEAAPEAVIFGGGAPMDTVRQALVEGAAASFGPGARDFGLDVALPEAEQAAREALQFQAHCNALPETMLPGMVEAQRLRDAALARAVIEAHEATGGPVVLITGSGHARTDWGVPALLDKAAPGLSVMSVGQAERGAEPDAPFDVLVVTEPVPRADPCDAFR